MIPSSAYESHRERHKRAGRPPHWSNEGRRNRELALKRDDYRCRRCGRSKQQCAQAGDQIQVHHVAGRTIAV